MLYMNKTDREKIVDAFYREYLKASVYKAGMWMFSGMAILLEFICIALPLSEMIKDIKEDGELMLFLLIGCSVWSAWLYLRPYRIYRENDKMFALEERLKYIPVDKADLYKFQIKRVILFLAKILPAAMLLQILTSVIAKTFSIWCIVYVLVVAFGIPFLVMMSSIWLEFIKKRDKKKGKLRTTIKYTLQHDMKKVLEIISWIIATIGAISVSLSIWIIENYVLFYVGIGILAIGIIGILLTGKESRKLILTFLDFFHI